MYKTSFEHHEELIYIYIYIWIEMIVVIWCFYLAHIWCEMIICQIFLGQVKIRKCQKNCVEVWSFTPDVLLDTTQLVLGTISSWTKNFLHERFWQMQCIFTTVALSFPLYLDHIYHLGYISLMSIITGPNRGPKRATVWASCNGFQPTSGTFFATTLMYSFFPFK